MLKAAENMLKAAESMLKKMLKTSIKTPPPGLSFRFDNNRLNFFDNTALKIGSFCSNLSVALEAKSINAESMLKTC